jgi:hypothetical protein
MTLKTKEEKTLSTVEISIHAWIFFLYLNLKLMSVPQRWAGTHSFHLSQMVILIKNLSFACISLGQVARLTCWNPQSQPLAMDSSYGTNKTFLSFYWCTSII